MIRFTALATATGLCLSTALPREPVALDVFGISLRITEFEAPHRFSFRLDVEGSGMTSVVVTPPVGPTVPLLDGTPTDRNHTESFPTLAALEAKFPPGAYSFVFNGGAQSISLTHAGYDPPADFVAISITPMFGGNTASTSPTFNWQICSTGCGAASNLDISLEEESGLGFTAQYNPPSSGSIVLPGGPLVPSPTQLEGTLVELERGRIYTLESSLENTVESTHVLGGSDVFDFGDESRKSVVSRFSVELVHAAPREVALVGSAGEVAFLDIESATVFDSVPLGSRASVPIAIAITPDHAEALVLCASGHIGFIDLWGRTLVSTLESLAGPEQQGATQIPNEFVGICVDPSGRTAFVTEGNESGQLFFIDVRTREFAQPPRDLEDDPDAVAIKSDGSRLFVLEREQGRILALPRPFTTTMPSTMFQSTGAGEIEAFVLSSREDRALLVGGDDSIYLLNARSNPWTLLHSVHIGASRLLNVNSVAITADGTRAVVANDYDQSISFLAIGPSTIALLDTIPVDGRIGDVALTGDGRRAVVTLPTTNQVSVVEVQSRAILATVSEGIGRAPEAVVVTTLPGRVRRR